MDMMLPLEMMYVFGLHKTQEMCDETVEKNLFYIKILP